MWRVFLGISAVSPRSALPLLPDSRETDLGHPGKSLPHDFPLATEQNGLSEGQSLMSNVKTRPFTASLGLNPDLLRAAGICLHVDLFASVRRDDLERGGRIVQSHRLDLGIGRQGVSDG